MVTTGVCDSCWGSGTLRQWPNWRNIEADRKDIHALRAELAQAKEEIAKLREGLANHKTALYTLSDLYEECGSELATERAAREKAKARVREYEDALKQFALTFDALDAVQDREDVPPDVEADLAQEEIDAELFLRDMGRAILARQE